MATTPPVQPKQQQPEQEPANPNPRQATRVRQRDELIHSAKQPEQPLFPTPDPQTFGTKVPDRITFNLLAEGNELVQAEIKALEAEREFDGIEAANDPEGKVLNQNTVAGHAVANLLIFKLDTVSTVITREAASKNNQIAREQGPRSVDWRLPLSQETLKYLAANWLYRFAFQYVSQQRSAGGTKDPTVVSGSYVRQQLAYFTTQNEPWSQKIAVVMTDWLTRFIATGPQSYIRLDSVMRKAVKSFGRAPDVQALNKENQALSEEKDQLQEQTNQILGALRGYQTELSGEYQTTGQAIDWLKAAEAREQQAKADRADTVIRAVAPSSAAVEMMVYLARDAPIIKTASAMAEDARPDGGYSAGGSLFAPSASLVSLMVGLSEGVLRPEAGVPDVNMTDVMMPDRSGRPAGDRPSADGGAGARQESAIASSVFPSSSLIALVQALLAAGSGGESGSLSASETYGSAAAAASKGGQSARPELGPMDISAIGSVFPSSSLISLVQLLLLSPVATEPAAAAERPVDRPGLNTAALFPSAPLVSSMVTLRNLDAPPGLSAMFPSGVPPVTYAGPEAPRPTVIVQRAAEPVARAVDPRTLFPSPDFVQTMALMARRVGK